MGKKILVVDDEPDVVTYLTTVLKDAGYETLEASNGEEAMEQILKNSHDLITLDITMPEMTGVKTYRTIKEDEKLKCIPVIIVTGVTHEFKQFISSRTQVPAEAGFFAPVAMILIFLLPTAKGTTTLTFVMRVALYKSTFLTTTPSTCTWTMP